jgi:hypothetical protein
LPIPADISLNNIVEYYTYHDLREGYCAGICNNEQKKQFKIWLVKTLIVNNLYKKYGIVFNDESEEKLKQFVVFDNEINQVGINRIRKIKLMIDKEGEFYDIASKFGDQIGQFKIENIEGVIKNLNVKFDDIENKKTSRIIFGTDGYYLFYINREMDPKSVSYVFVAAKNFDDFLLEELDGYKFWSLVE